MLPLGYYNSKWLLMSSLPLPLLSPHRLNGELITRRSAVGDIVAIFPDQTRAPDLAATLTYYTAVVIVAENATVPAALRSPSTVLSSSSN